MRFHLLLTLACSASLAACAGTRGAPVELAVEPAEEWRSVASAEDAALLEGLVGRWRSALAAAKAKGFTRRIAAAGALLDPEAGQPRAAPGPGPYRCTLTRIGPAARRTPAWSESREAFCFVGVGEDKKLTLTSELPGRRVGGYLFEQGQGDALVFLGAAIPRGRSVAPRYGDDGAEGAAGLFERIDELSYRLVLPEPGSGVHVIALTPAPRD